MRFGLLSIVELHNTPFIVLLIYQTDEQGISSPVTTVMKPYGDFIDLLDDLYAYNLDELQTDSQQVYRELIGVHYPVIYRREVEGTREALQYDEDMLVELYELDKPELPPFIPTWRLWCINKLEQLIKILQTKGIKTDDTN
ncbi:hypothetical protein [Lysinibacillus sp.]|uniref:hypothetical protein n=1 Tax=Lysinibacillus sp. TaxID=1869345 RepID=UPI00289DB15A|nr:hypothetical protein [Lysinibacillus sp.]